MVIEIHKGETLSLEKIGSRWGLRTLEGTIWLTQTCDAHDYILSAGTEDPCLKDGHVVIEALTETVRIELVGQLNGQFNGQFNGLKAG